MSDLPDVLPGSDEVVDVPTAARRIVAAQRFPHPGAGETIRRWEMLADHTRADVATGRMVEAHADAQAILTDLGRLHDVSIPATRAGDLWGVWAAEAPDARVTATAAANDTWRLAGVKPWCSGAVGATHALVTAWVEQDRALFAVRLSQPGVAAVGPPWVGAGMAATSTRSMEFTDAQAVWVGSGDDYLRRPGFWHGAAGVAACWWGGAACVAERVRRTSRRDDITLSHIGAVDAAVWSGWSALRMAADEIDSAPDDLAAAHRTALRTRAHIEAVVHTVLDRAGRCLGPGPLATEASYAAAVADVAMYVRQSHADHDLRALGALACGDAT